MVAQQKMWREHELKDSYDVVIVGGGVHGLATAYYLTKLGIRNVADLDACLREVHRTLAPGARFVILEFSTPRLALARAAYHAYFHHVLPRIGGLVSGHRTAYTYLPDSVRGFPEASQLAERMRGAGFGDVQWQSLTLGIAAVHVGTKDDSRQAADDRR